MHSHRHYARGSLGSVDLPGGFKRAHDLNAEVHVHWQITARGVVIEKHVVPICAKARLGPQELPHLVERGLPRSSDAADCDATPDGGKPEKLPATMREGVATFRVPNLKVYDLVLLRMEIPAGRVVAVELKDDIAGARLALERLAAPAARERLAAMVGDRFGRGRRVGVGIGDIDARDDVTLGHDGSL